VRASLERVLAMVRRQGMRLAKQCTPSVRGSIGVETDDGSKESRILRIVLRNMLLETVVAKRDVFRSAIAIRNGQGNQDSAIRYDPDSIGPSIRVKSSTGVPSRIFPNGCLLTPVFGSAIHAQREKACADHLAGVIVMFRKTTCPASLPCR
jgi:hypothetical protein